MKITAHQKRELETQVVSLENTKSVLSLEIIELRRWKTEVYQEALKIWNDKEKLDALLNALIIAFDTKTLDFYKLTDKQIHKIWELSEKINIKKQELDVYEAIPLIDKEKENQKIKQEIWEINKQKIIELEELDKVRKEKQEFIQWKTQEENKIKEDKEKIKTREKELNDFDLKLVRREKRLNNLKKSIYG